MDGRTTTVIRETQYKVPEKNEEQSLLTGKYSWVETSVWPEKMLTALETGLKGGKWYSFKLIQTQD